MLDQFLQIFKQEVKVGLNISIETKDYKEHPDWDFARYTNDVEFNKLYNDVAEVVYLKKMILKTS